MKQEINILKILLITAVIVIGVLIIHFLIVSGKKNEKDAPHALGLPQGSVRALLSISLTVFFIFAALFFYIDSSDDHSKNELAKSILTILGTLVIAVSSFYFGTKATEQGNKIAQETFKSATKNYDASEGKNVNIPPEVIKEALANNKETWKKKYRCANIKYGKKKTGGVQFELNCLVFLVNPKIKPDIDEQEIPPIIKYNSKGVNYKIPTDVVHLGSIEENQDITSSLKVSLNTVEEAITENKEEWIAKYRADDILAALKVRNGQRYKTPCIQFIVKKKSIPANNTFPIPEYLYYQNLNIPTDVIEEDQPSADVANVQVGDTVWRKGTTARGTLGIKVYRDNANGTREDYLLSCYHVFCNTELKAGTKKYSPTSTGDTSVMADLKGSTVEVAQVVEGDFNSRMDAALSKIKDNVSINHALKGIYGSPKYGIRIITNEEVENEISVFSHGAVSKTVSGYVKARVTGRTIDFNGTEHYFKDIIPVSKISEPGDSGAMVVDEKGKIIGIVFASNSHTSYLIPILEIITHFKIKIHYA